MTKDKPIAIIRLDRTTWETVCRSLRYLHDHFDVPHAIDRAKIMANKTEVRDTLSLIECAQLSRSNYDVSMSMDEWSLYTHIIAYTCSILPPERVADAEKLEVLFDQYSDWDEGGIQPFAAH